MDSLSTERTLELLGTVHYVNELFKQGVKHDAGLLLCKRVGMQFLTLPQEDKGDIYYSMQATGLLGIEVMKLFPDNVKDIESAIEESKAYANFEVCSKNQAFANEQIEAMDALLSDPKFIQPSEEVEDRPASPNKLYRCDSCGSIDSDISSELEVL